MIDKLAHVKIVIDNVNSMIISAKKEFAEVISDKSYPLEDRWDLFTETPEPFKEHEPFIVHFDFEKSLGVEIHDFCFAERYMVQHTEDIVECVDFPEESINIMKEEILQKNIGSFVFDW